MSVLSNPQGTPERVWSLVAGVASLRKDSEQRASIKRATLEACFNPGYQNNGRTIEARAEFFNNTFGAATSLSLLEVVDGAVMLCEDVEATSYAALADCVHDRLCCTAMEAHTAKPDAVILEAYAWMAARSGQEGDLNWVYDLTRDQFADEANQALAEDGRERAINTTKIVAWRRWLLFIGLSVPMPRDWVDYPLPASRLARELCRNGLRAGQALSAQDFLAILSQRLPYLDGGRLFERACQRIGYKRDERRLSALTSGALRDLHDAGVLDLRISGDSPNTIGLSYDPAHAVQTFDEVVILEGESAE